MYTILKCNDLQRRRETLWDQFGIKVLYMKKVRLQGAA